MTPLTISIFAVLFCACATAYCGRVYTRLKTDLLLFLFAVQLFLLGFNVSIMLQHFFKVL